jgi:hypothetical protein
MGRGGLHHFARIGGSLLVKYCKGRFSGGKSTTFGDTIIDESILRYKEFMTCFVTLLICFFNLSIDSQCLFSRAPWASGNWQFCTTTTTKITLLRASLLIAFRFPRCLVVARTASAATTNALNFLILLQLPPRHTADACAVEVGLLGLNAAQAAELSRETIVSKVILHNLTHAHPATHLLIALLLPLRDEHRVGVVVFEQPVVQLLADGFLLIVQIVDVS